MKSKNIEDIYELSPMQQGMLFHTIDAPETAIYVEQFSYTLQGVIDIPALKRAWQHVVDRHPVLRSSFLWQEIDKPLQIVHKQVTLPFTQHDWRDLSTNEQNPKLNHFLETDRIRGFDLSRPPLMRLALIQLTKNTHQFVWSNHHLLLDGWSASLLLKEVLAFYEAFRQGEMLNLAQSLPYRDYIIWLQSQDLFQAQTFWQESLKGFAAPTPLPISTRQPDGEYGETAMHLPASLTAECQQLAKTHRLTLGTIIQGAYAILLSRYTDQNDVLFGITVSGRPPNLPGAEQMIGLFINTLPLRVRIDPTQTTLSWLQSLQAHNVELRQYEYTPLWRVREWSELPRDLPLFESLFVFENLPVVNFSEEWVGSFTIGDSQAFERTNYPLTVVSAPGRRLLLRVLYDNGRISNETADRILTHLQCLLTDITANPTKPLGRLQLLTQAERRQLLVEWNDTTVVGATHVSPLPHHRIAEWAKNTPEKTAVIHNDQTLTYTQLNQRTNQLAHHLQSLGAGPETIVAICLNRSTNLIIAALAALKAGAAYLPIDPTYPPDRIRYMLTDAGAAILLADTPNSPFTLHHLPFTIVNLSDWQAIANQPTNDLWSSQPTNQLFTHNLAYVIYTSGSTGRPKGVQIEHAALNNLIGWHQQAFQLTAADHTTQLAGISFDASVWEMWPTLTAGATLHIPTKDILTDPIRLQEWLIKQGITVAFLPTSLAELMLDLEWPTNTPLRLLLTGGDTLHKYPSHTLPFTLINNYGPTENAVVTTSAPVFPTVTPHTAPPIGRPIANTQVYILDSELQPVPI
ncbi:MAG: AMP-binding protein, partial [Anaerolinea sp.]|nr:AMP-binding protein [Anaerolinea sp.]